MNHKKESKFLKPLYHVLAWSVIFIVPMLIFASEGKPLRGTFERTASQMYLFIVLFYLNYCWIIRAYLFKKCYVWFAFINLFLILLMSNMKYEFLFNNPFLDSHRKPPPPQGFIYFDFLSNLLPVAFAVAIKYAERFFALELAQKEMMATKFHTELQHLKYQLQPHFFFNALNNIYSLIAFDPDKAQKSVHSLSKLMRHFLQKSDQKTILLCDEIIFLNQYIELMLLRLTEKTKVITDFPKEVPKLNIAPLLFITLVENAFKHGVSASKETEIYFSLQTDGKNIRFVSENTLLTAPNNDLYSSSIGIENLQKQLDLLYPNQNTYTISTENGKYKAEICIQA